MANYKKITLSEELDLIKKAQQDSKLRSEFVLRYKPYLFNCIKRFYNQGINKDDLLNEGIIGLLVALDKFDITQGCRFITFASWYVFSYMIIHIQKNQRMINVASSLGKKDLLSNLGKIKQHLGIYGDTLTTDDIEKISHYLKINKKEIEGLYILLSNGDLSIDGFNNNWLEENTSLLEKQDSFEYVEQKDYIDKKMILVHQALKKIKPRSKDIFIKRRLKDKPDTLEKLAKEYNITRERVRQIEKRAYEVIQKYVIDHEHT